MKIKNVLYKLFYQLVDFCISVPSVAFQTVTQKLFHRFCATWTTYGYHGISHERQGVISNDMDQKIGQRNGEAMISA